MKYTSIVKVNDVLPLYWDRPGAYYLSKFEKDGISTTIGPYYFDTITAAVAFIKSLIEIDPTCWQGWEVRRDFKSETHEKFS